MKTLFALLIMSMAFTVGLAGIAIVMVIMGLAGAPGAILFASGQKSKNAFVATCGLIVAGIGQSFIVAAYAVFAVGALRWFAEGRPDVPVWPLWIAVFFHSAAVPIYAMKERPEKPTAQHHTLGFVALVATAAFFLATFAPKTLQPIYGWVPLYDRLLRGGVSNAILDNAVPVRKDVLTHEQRQSVQAFYAGYQYLQDIQLLSKHLPNSSRAGAIGDFRHIESLMDKAIERLGECDIARLNGIQPGWGDATRDQFISGLNKMKSGIKPGGDRADLARADALLGAFDSWLRANWEQIGQKIGD